MMHDLCTNISKIKSTISTAWKCSLEAGDHITMKYNDFAMNFVFKDTVSLT